MHIHRVLLAIFAVAVTGAAGATPQLSFNPSCPVAGEEVIITSIQRDPGEPSFFAVQSMALSTPSVFKIVYRATGSSYGGAPPQRVDAKLPPLPVGDYLIDVYYRIDHGNDVLGPEIPAATARLVVAPSAPTVCPNLLASAVGAMVREAQLGSLFPPLIVRVVDGAGKPIPGVSVSFRKLSLSGDVSGVTDNGADATLSEVGVVSDLDGLAQTQAMATGRPGHFQYIATMTHLNERQEIPFILRNLGGIGTLSAKPVVEYYNRSLNHYFITANRSEMAQLDAGVVRGWSRTGAVFGTYDDQRWNPVCRFYGRPEADLDSHFYSASPDECRQVIERFSSTWMLETWSAFEAGIPTNSGKCQNGTPIYRLFNNRLDANHRYVNSLTAAQAMVHARGYIAEGYGEDAVSMCLMP